ncbi:hypothetical protein CDIK_1116 [Cucumispora dikerogammari]|nr:hypothetical protein CDIK_1116 [Cucumispora dikerogammari]
MGIKSLSNYKGYWVKTSSLTYCSIISCAIFINRFTFTIKHITRISSKDYNENSRISNTPKIIVSLNNIFLGMRFLPKNVAIGENLMPFQSNLASKVFSQKNPKKYKLEIYMLADPTAVYILR